MLTKSMVLVLLAFLAVPFTGATAPTTTTSQFQPFTANRTTEKKMAFNIGYSRLDTSSYQGPSASGLAFEGQYAFHKKVLAAAGFFHYDYSNAGNSSSNFQMASIGAELQPIQTDIFNGSEFFAAVTTGGAHVFNSNNSLNLYYGAGLGVKINDEVGIRFDIKSGRNYITSNSFSLVGYY